MTIDAASLPPPSLLSAPTGSRTDPAQGEQQRFRFDVLPVLLVLAIALVLAGHSYLQYLDTSRLRWDGLAHDRSGHYAYGLKMAIALRQGKVLRFIDELERGKVWPPVHGVLVAMVLLVGGFHYQLAVLPSLIGWIMTVVFGFLVARRAAARRDAGLLAGVVALIFIVGSPAHRIYATDIMLESLGAGLTLLVLYLYLLAVQRGTSLWTWRGLALALTVLFFEKYNYWLLVILSMLTTQFVSGPRQYLRSAVVASRTVDWRRWVTNQARQPLNYILVGLVAVVLFLFARGPTALQIAGHRVSLYPPHNLVTAAYAVLLVRVAIALRRERPKWLGRLSIPSQQVLRWHVLPIAFSFLLPRRLSAFLWHIGPTNHGDEPVHDLARAASFYARSLTTDYHVGLWSVLLVAGLLAAAILCGRRLRPGASVVLFLALIAAALVVVHPNQKSRYLHSWLPAAWVGAGMGLACLLYSRPLDGLRRSRWWLAAGVVGLLAVGHRTQLLAVGHSPEAGHQGRDSSLLDLTDTYLPHLARSRRTTILTTVPFEPLFQWTFLERYQNRERLDILRWGPSPSVEGVRDRFEAWLQSTQSDTLVLIDIPPGSYFHGDVGLDYRAFGHVSRLLASQTTFRQTHRWNLTRYGCTITLWRRL